MAATTTQQPAGAWRAATDPTDELPPILRHALDAFYEFGYHGTSVRDIAKRADLTVPALYYHYENKEAILYTLLDRSIGAAIERCQQAVAEAPDYPGAAFRNLIECLALFMAQQGKRAAMDAEIRALGPVNRRRYAARRAIIEKLLEASIQDGADQGVFELSSPHETTRAILGMLWAITVWYKPGGKMSATTIAASYVDIALQTVGAKRSGPTIQLDGPARQST
jgi:AcrR family transcriptional regulator